jgi:hypothetical protein
MRIDPVRIPWRTLALVAVLVAGASGTAAQPKAPSGKMVPTDRGSFHGTWTYVNRDGRTVLWIDTSGKTLRVKMQYQGTSKPEGFVTDWDGNATYIFAGEPGTFELRTTEANENRIRGTWFWDVQFESVGRSERGTFTLYRVGDGRQLVLDFSEYEKVLRKGDKVSRYEGPASWTFKKVSRRIALWDEVY